MLLKSNEPVHTVHPAVGYLLRLCSGAWWRARTPNSRPVSLCRCIKCMAAITGSPKLPCDRVGNIGDRSWPFDQSCCAGALRQPILDAMDKCNAVPDSADAYRYCGSTKSDPPRLLVSRDTLELSDVNTTGSRNFLAPAANKSERCRCILENLLAPLAPDQARRWSIELIKRFGTLAAVLAADMQSIKQYVDDEKLTLFIHTVHMAHLHTLRVAVDSSPILSTSESVINYLTVLIAHDSRECLRVLFLNISNRLLADEEFGKGSLNHMSIYPREIIRRALELGSTAIILVHNHPSGSPRPSESDISATDKLIKAAAPFDIVIHDHVIVATGGFSSFRLMGIL